jgi:hypothetical protein
MKRIVLIPALIVPLAVQTLSHHVFATSPFTEDFASSASNWADGSGANLANYVASGGPDGSSYASSTATGLNAADGVRMVVFRGQDEFNSSSHAFEGNWLATGINHFRAYVRHNAPVSLPFFVRFATPSNSPGTGAEDGSLVPPNTWTQMSFDILPASINVTLFPEGPPSVFGGTFSNIGHIQIGYTVPAGFGADPNTYTFGLDQLSISAVPEPAGWLLAIGCLATGVVRRRPRVG